jgi:hypothetical protein
MVRKTAKVETVVVEAEEGSTSLVKAITEGAAGACSAAANIVPATGKVVRKTVYSGFYYVTYGVVFSSLMIGSLIPTNNAMGEGVQDGVSAARKAFKERQDSSAVSAAAATPA